MSTRFDPSKRTLQVVTYVDKTDDKYSHAIPVVPEFPSDTDYNINFYADRRAENNRLAGLSIQYAEGDSMPPIGIITIGTVTIFGDTDVELNTTHSYSITSTGNAQDTTVVYTTDNPTDVISGSSITFNSSGSTTVTATVTSPTATDSPQTATYVVSVGDPPITLGTATIFGDSVVYDSTAHTYQVTISGSADINDCTVVYTTDDPADIISDDTITFVGDGIRTHVVTATVTHPTAGDSPVTATYVVEVKGAPGFDNFSIGPGSGGGTAISFGKPFSTQMKGLDPGYTSNDYLYFYDVVGSNTATAYVRVVNQANKEPYWVYDVSKAPFDNTPCIVTETFTLKSDPSVTAAFNTAFTLHNY